MRFRIAAAADAVTVTLTSRLGMMTLCGTLPKSSYTAVFALQLGLQLKWWTQNGEDFCLFRYLITLL